MNRIYEAVKYFKRVATREKRILPGFIIIGATRSGTTSLYEYLASHPSMLAPVKKETAFFNYAYNNNSNWYRMYFSTIDEKEKAENIRKNSIITGEATPSYLIDPRVPKRILSLLPKVKLIALLRNPIDRAISHYHLNVLLGIEKLSFEQAVKNESERIKISFENLENITSKDENSVSYFLRMLSFKPENYFKFSYLYSGCYYNHLKNWFDVFPREQILVIKSEDFFENPKIIFEEVQGFLELPIIDLQKYWRAYEIKYSSVSENMKKYLQNYFEPHNSKLYELLKMDYHWS